MNDRFARSPRAFGSGRPVNFALLNAVQDKNSLAGVAAVALWFGLTEGQTAKF
jgi:hypothetical protein